MEFEVFIKKTTFVKPSSKLSSSPQTIELSGLDRISPAILNTLFFYKNNSKSEKDEESDDGDDVERVVIRGLERVLVSWFPAAGRLRINEKKGNKLEINCNDEGVLLVIAHTSSKLQDFGDHQLHQYNPSYEKLVPHFPHNPPKISQNPLVALQFASLTASWAQISRAKHHDHDDDDLINNNINLPNHSRQKLFNVINNINNNSDHLTISSSSSSSIYEQQHIGAIQDLYGIPMRAMAANDTCWESELAKLSQSAESRGIQLLTLSIEKEAVERLKGVVVQSGKLFKCSTFDLLCAHVWKISEITIGISGSDFTGNAFVLASVSSTAKQLTEEPLEETIGKIQGAKEVLNNDYIKEYVKALENSSDKFLPSMRELTIVSDWLKFPFGALDFGWRNNEMILCGAALVGTPVPEACFLMPDLDQDRAGDFLKMIRESV
ncbi:hypothetical protein F8388_018595 [Cannabis sativa]|uniref:Uncharacterized protein n=1 Tax=Cannabis sativa TaxID=3483 RepID=A0A7J6FCP8_CANSA|nr:hypothetical protein F8388_018595 [Cannabis sativa]